MKIRRCAACFVWIFASLAWAFVSEASPKAVSANAASANAASANAVSEKTLSAIAAQMEKHPVVVADFIQTRKMADVKRPLITKGKLVVSRQHGVLWKIEEPYRIRYFLGEDKIIEAPAEGVRKERSAETLPGMAQVGRIFRAMLGAQAKALEEHFHVEAQGDERQWEIRLRPRQAGLAQFLSSMRISGGQYVNFIQITEAGGDSTDIRFEKSQGAKALGEPERAEFNALGITQQKEP